LESPCLCSWLNQSTSWEWWEVGVGSCVWLLAGLNSNLGSVSHELLGSTAAESIITFWSWLTSFLWVSTVSTSCSSSWECGLLVICGLNRCSSRSVSLSFSKEILHGFLSFIVTNTLACSNGSFLGGFGGSDGSIILSNGSCICGDLSINCILRFLCRGHET